MIPDYLQGMSAAQIVDKIRGNYLHIETGDYEGLEKSYGRYLEGLLLLAVKNALCNADPLSFDGFGSTYDSRGREAEGRAVAFLNIVLPVDKQKERK